MNTERFSGSGLMKNLIFSFTIIFLIANCNQSFSLVDVIDGPEGLELRISPELTQVGVLKTTQFSATGGIPPYTFSLLEGLGMIDSVTGLYRAPSVPGSSTIQVTDDYGLIDTATVTVIAIGDTLLNLSPESAQVVILETIAFTATGGIPPYTYSIQNGLGTINSSSGVFTAPATSGSCTILVSDTSGLTDTASVAIIDSTGPPPALGITPSSIGIYSGNSVTFNAVGGTGPFTYSLLTPIGGTGEFLSGNIYTAPGDTAGTALVRVTDSLSSTADAAVTVTAVAGPTLSISPLSIDLNLSDSISLSASGGESPYTFSLLSPIAGAGESLVGSTYTAPSDMTGTATVRVTDNMGVTADSTVTVTPSSALAISPVTIGLNLNGTIDFSTSGGVPPYTYSLLTPLTGTGESLTGSTYTAPSDNAGTATVRVTDNMSNTEDATITVSPASVLTINPSTVTLNQTNSVIFSASGGVPPYTYSLTTSLGGLGESLITNIYTAPSNSAGNATVRVTDNVGTTSDAAITVQPPPDIDYEVTSVSNNTPAADVSTAISGENFIIENTGSDDGNSSVTWTAYASTDQILDITIDTFISSGNIAALTASGSSGAITLTGTWPATAGAYYVLIKVASSDETDTFNNYSSSGLFTISPTSGSEPDYTVSNVSHNFITVTMGSPVSETFDLTNIGFITGTSTGGIGGVEWEAFVCDSAYFDGSEKSLGTGTTGFLAAGASTYNIPISTTWTWTGMITGMYYLIIEVTDVGDGTRESIISNNTSYAGPFTIYDPPDYEVTAPVLPIVTIGGNLNENLFSAAENQQHTFTITESAGNGGQETINWTAYRSTDEYWDELDPVVDSGSMPPLTGSGSSLITIDEFNTYSLPATSGYYYIMLQIEAGDDSNSVNNFYLSGPISVWETPISDLETTLDGLIAGNVVDYSIMLHPGDILIINGKMDDTAGFFDNYAIRTSSATNTLDIEVTWSAACDLDLYLTDSLGTVASSIDTSNISESPISTGVTSLEEHHILINFYSTVNNADYVLTVTAGP
ncbi:MAG: hypothetical protein JEY91_12200 [Spirochaetaceae bacterium]|nr:hypothetical protein [Spirochaetaceae bacterium]